MESKSTAYQLLQFVWRNERTKSLITLNHVMQDALHLAISAKLQFDKSDFSEILKNFRGGHWFGVNSNGKGSGERFYSSASRIGNTPACISYESFVGIKPFKTTKGHRCHQGKLFNDAASRRYTVTGFDFEKKTISLVSYDDYREEGKRKLHSFDNKEWLVFRKELKEF